jgi:hypothetical protein
MPPNPKADHPVTPRREISNKDYHGIRYHFSSYHNKTYLCPYRSQYSERNCPFASDNPEIDNGCCVFAHRKEDLRSDSEEEFNLHDFKTKAKMY